MEFLNEGKKAGTIQDIYLNISSRGFTTKYVPTYEINGERLYGMEIWKECPHITSKPFQAFNLFGESTITKFLLFMPILGKENGAFNLREGNYSLTVFVESSTSKSYEKKAHLNLTIPKAAITATEGNNRVFVRNDGTTDITSVNGTTFILYET